MDTIFGSMREIDIERKEYEKGTLSRSMLFSDPIQQFGWWLEEAFSAKILEPTAMLLSTVGEKGPSSRMVLLKGIDDVHGFFYFYTNYESRKAKDIDQFSSRVSLLFYWKELERQVLIEADAHKAPRELNESYFSRRPRLSQIAAWASDQDSPIPSRDFLLEKYQECEKKFENMEVPCPPFWGGYVCTPRYFEFWQGRQNRLHDRFSYTPDIKNSEGTRSWVIERLSP